MTIRAKIEGNKVVIRADNESRADLADCYRAGGYPRAEQTVIEELHDRWMWLNPEDIGALTSAPIFGNDVSYDDNGNVTEIGVIAWFSDYCIRDPFRELANHGRVVFTIEEN